MSAVKVTPIEPGDVPHELMSALMETMPTPTAVVQLEGVNHVVAIWPERWRCGCGDQREGSMEDAGWHLIGHRRTPWWRRLLRALSSQR
jgi:hypothetical protein